MSKLPDYDALWNYGDPEGTEAAFRGILERVEGSAPSAYLASLLTQIARTQGLQQQFEAAHATLDRAEAMLTQDMGKARVRLLLERGRVVNSSGKKEESIPYFEQALELADKLDLQFFAVDAAHMLGIVCPGETALEWNKRALAMANAATEPKARTWRGSLCNNLGWTYFGLKRYQDALGMFEQYLAVRTEEKDEEQVGIAKWSMAKMYRYLDRVEEAMAIQRELLKREDTKDNASEGYAREELGECLLALGRGQEAAPHFARAYELLSADPWVAKNEAERLARLKELGGLD